MKKNTQSSKKLGRPTSYTKKLAEKICTLISSGQSVLSIATGSSMPAQSTIYKWLCEHPDFSEKYRRAREAQADYYVDEIIELADACEPDMAAVAKVKAQIDARKWYVEKVSPRKYGAKQTTELIGAGGGPIKTEMVNLTLEEAAALYQNLMR